MSDIAVKIDNVSKQYRLGLVGTGTLSHDLNRWWHNVRGKPNPYLKVGESNERSKRGNSEYVWALRDVNLEIRQGEVLGIIGENGAGKSTLLKILSRVTAPTAGELRIKGRLASLLEVGTGFHPELTGRENVFLNGAILGMGKAEIRRKLDEIVEFSECERYLDTAVKRYSSGMCVRLAFAVAAHLDPEILVIDEVLAVGDIGFQNKCLERLRSLTRGGATTLLVSHNMASIERLCERTLWMDQGTVAQDGATANCVRQFSEKMNSVAEITVGQYLNSPVRRGSGEVRFVAIETINKAGQLTTTFEMGDDLRIRARYRAVRDVAAPEVYFVIRDIQTGTIVTSTSAKGLLPNLVSGQEGIVECVFDCLRLCPRKYSLWFGLCDPFHIRLSYDVWDGAGPTITVVEPRHDGDPNIDPVTPNALVSLTSRLSHEYLAVPNSSNSV